MLERAVELGLSSYCAILGIGLGLFCLVRVLNFLRTALDKSGKFIETAILFIKFLRQKKEKKHAYIRRVSDETTRDESSSEDSVAENTTEGLPRGELESNLASTDSETRQEDPTFEVL